MSFLGKHWGRVTKAISDHSMSIMLSGLFLLAVLGQALTGRDAYNHALQQSHLDRLGWAAYLRTGNFLDGIFSNWEAALLQLAVLITLGAVLRQKGAPHSRKRKPKSGQKRKLSLGKTSTSWLYANSLSIAFTGMFVATFALHAIFGEWKYNESQALLHLGPMPFGSYIRSSTFWFSNFQCWEAEFSAIGLYIVLSIFLRQDGSPESKPVEASNEQTGGPNE